MGTLESGEILRGKYRIERRIGAGGMGVVLLATHVRLGQQVALKLLRRSEMGDGSRVDDANVARRFAREARIAARLKGEHTVRILDVDDAEDGEAFLVMEYLEGTDLQQLLVDRASGLSIEEAVGYVLQACEGVAEAHALGIVHRDLKPANLFLTKRPDGSELIKLLDFGISKAFEPEAHDLGITRPHVAMGSPSYMSPEQLKDAGEVDERTDIWALGVVLYQLLVDKLPFDATTPTALTARIVTDPPASLRFLRSEVPPGLEAIVLRCLEKAPAKRFPSVAELARALAPFAVDGAASADRTLRVGEEARKAPRVEPPRVSTPATSKTSPQAGSEPTADMPAGAPLSPLLMALGAEVSASKTPTLPPGPGPSMAGVSLRSASVARIAGVVLVATLLVGLAAFALRRSAAKHERGELGGPLSAARAGAGVCPTYVVAGDTHTCIRRSDGSLLCWGDNRYVQLGTGDTTSSATPRDVRLDGVSKIFLPTGKGDITLDVAEFSCAVTTANALFCWGDNRWKQFGANVDRALSPIAIPVPRGLSHASVGAGHICTLSSDNSLACFGNNASGQVGVAGPENQPTPHVVEGVFFDKIVTGSSHTCARRPDATMLCWGANEYGQLGRGDTTPSSKPVELTSLARRVARLAAGANHTCAQTPEGDLHCWGDNRYGQLGTGDRVNQLQPRKVSGTADASAKIYAGGAHSCAVHADGSFWCWGDNRSGQLGLGDTQPRLVATRVDALGNDVAAAYAGGAHTCALKTDGSVWCWGNNQYGQLGVGVGSKATAPAMVIPPCR